RAWSVTGVQTCALPILPPVAGRVPEPAPPPHPGPLLPPTPDAPKVRRARAALGPFALRLQSLFEDRPEAVERLCAAIEARAAVRGLDAALGELDRELSQPRWKGRRSEEHTSELQSLTNLVCRLLLEKKTNNRAIVRTKISLYTVLAATAELFVCELRAITPVCVGLMRAHVLITEVDTPCSSVESPAH